MINEMGKANCMGNDVFSKECDTWAAENPANTKTRNDMRIKWCNSTNTSSMLGSGGFNSDLCRHWCITDGKGQCDASARIYCSNHDTADDIICDCINSPLSNPQCDISTQDGEDVSELTAGCRNYGYWTSNMTSIIDNQACPSVYYCNQDWDIHGSENITHDNTMVQICGGELQAPADVPPKNTDVPVAPQRFNLNPIIAILIVVLVYLYISQYYHNTDAYASNAPRYKIQV